MIRRFFSYVLLTTCFGLAVTPAALAQAVPAPTSTELDGVANARLLDQLFSRYGFEPLKTMRREGQGMRIRLPGGKKDIGQTGIYSYVALAGNFTIEARYVVVGTPVHKSGYGMSCGLALDTHGPAGQVSLARNYSKHKGGSGYAVTVGKPVDGQMKYETQIFPTSAKNGQLAFRREKADLVCLAADGKGELKELCRLPFTDGTVRQVRLYADAGGSPTPLDVWVGGLRVRADEITGGFPKLERRGGLGWWPLVGAVFVAAVGTLLAVRRRQGKWPWPEQE